MSVREYIGARYIPLFMGEWDATKSYEPLSIVQYQGNSYTSRQYVPIGIEITDEIYWAETGNYNAQIEQYRQTVLEYIEEVSTFDNRITSNENEIEDIKEKFISGALNYQTLGQIVYEYHNGMIDHPGCICQDANGQIILSSPFSETNTTNNGHFRRVNIENNYDNWQNNVSGDYGHANSCCFSSEIGSIIYAPIWRVENGTKINVNKIEKLSSAGAITGYIDIENDANPYAVSYDAAKNKTYCFCATNNFTVDIFVYDNASNKFISTGNSFYFPYDNDSLRQDVAVYNGKFYASNINGSIIYGNVETGDIIGVMTLSASNDMQVNELSEIDGMEFNSDGILLSLLHSTCEYENSAATVCSIIEIITNETTNTFARYTDFKVAEPSYTKHINPNSTLLHTRGTQQAPYKSIYQMQLATNHVGDAYFTESYNADFIYIFMPLCLHPAANVTITCNTIRLSSNASIGYGSNTGKIKTNKIVYDTNVQLVTFLNSTKIELPADYEINSNGHSGIIIIINNNVTFINPIKIGGTSWEQGNKYCYIIGLGQVTFEN